MTDKPTVTQADRVAAAAYQRQPVATDSNPLDQAFAAHRKAAIKEAVGDPVAYMYTLIRGGEGFIQRNRANMDSRYWLETPLYALTSAKGQGDE